MSERVQSADLGVRWDPNAPEAVLVSDDGGGVVLALNPHPEDDDRRSVILAWGGARCATMSDPNDEAISGHRLYRLGLADVLWVGVVHDSQLIVDLEVRNRVHPLHDAQRFDALMHHVLPLKECVVEVVATELTISRVAEPTRRAALRLPPA